MATDTKPTQHGMPSLSSLTKNKPLLYGVAAAGGLGLYTLYRRRSGASASATPAANASTAAGTYNGAAGMDTTGTSVASWLGNYSGSLQNQLDAFGQQLTDSIGGLKQVQNALPGISGLTVNVSGGKAIANWQAVPGADWYTVFWQTPNGSTGGTTIQSTSASADLGALGLKPGQSITALVFPQTSGSNGQAFVRGPDATATAKL